MEVVIIIFFAIVLGCGFYRLALNSNYAAKPNVKSKILSVLKVPDIEFVTMMKLYDNLIICEEKFHPGTFKTLGNKEFEDEILDHLKKTIYAYKPKVYNSLETGILSFFDIKRFRCSKCLCSILPYR